MIRFEIHSNVASSEQGLRQYPALADLAETFRLWNIEARFVRQTFRSEEEINVASSRHARGVTVRGKSLRELTPETHLRGCLHWMRAVVAGPQRALHLEIDTVRSANGAPLVFAQILARKQRVFVSGLERQDFLRLTARPDPACREVPPAIARAPALRQDYLERADRPAGFFALLQRIHALGLVNGHLRPLLQEVLASRQKDDLKRLNPAQIVNLALLHEYLERYEKLVLQFTAMLQAEQMLGDLPRIFELFTQGIAFEQLRNTFLEFTLEEKRNQIRDKRGLVNELRIGLTRADEGVGEEFSRRLTRLVVLNRARQDPKLYALAIPVLPVHPDAGEGLAAPRRMFAEWLHDPTAAGPPGAPSRSAAGEDKQRLFELVVGLVFQGKFTHAGREDALPPSAVVARDLLSCLVFDHFDIRNLFKLHPNLPARGVARNLADKVPVSHEEMERLRAVLLDALFPMGKLAGDIAAGIRADLRHQQARQREREMDAYLLGAVAQVGAMNYLLGPAGQTPLLRRTVLAAGRMLGLNLQPSHGPAGKTSAAGAAPDEREGLAGGYLALMASPRQRFFPLQAPPALHAAALRTLVQHHAVLRIRRMVDKKLNFLAARHENRLFDVCYDFLKWNHRLSLSRAQLGRLLESGRLFDRERLAEFGLNPRERNFAEGEDPRLASGPEGDEARQRERFANDRVKAELQQALAGFADLVQGYGRPASADGEESPPLKSVLADLAAREQFDLRGDEAREALTRSRESGLLSQAVRDILLPRGRPLLELPEEGGALEIRLTGSMAYLALLREFHEVELDGQRLRVRLKPARFLGVAAVDEFSHAVGGELLQWISSGKAGDRLHQAVVMLNQHDELWERLVQAATVPLLDQLLRETVLRLVRPSPPLPKHLPAISERNILCLSASSSDQARFSRIVKHPERRDVYATLSELAGWLMRFRRLRDEMAYFREVSGDILEIIAGFNLSAFDAPYLHRYGRQVKELQFLLNPPPEALTLGHLADIEAKAREIGGLVREAYDQERSLGLRDRWMGRVAMKLREMHPHLKPTFVDLLFEKRAPAPGPAGGEDREDSPGGPSVEAYQTFSERVRNVVEIRQRLEQKQVFVMSPAHTQKQLTLTLIDHIHRFKGMLTPVFIDVTHCAAFINELRARIPPYRLFDLNAI